MSWYIVPYCDDWLLVCDTYARLLSKYEIIDKITSILKEDALWVEMLRRVIEYENLRSSNIAHNNVPPLCIHCCRRRI